ncbi:hypothetical protein KY342_06425 [Candidatus Woesearchaeota archaeon]|nr:hypothetical protein [Candidatus Woesearchaeota archaeon]
MKKMTNESEPLERLLERVSNAERKESVYVCVFVEEGSYDEVSKLAEKYGVLGHSFDKKHVYLRAKNRRKAKGLLKKVLNEKKPIEGVKGAYVNTISSPAPGLDLDMHRFRLESSVDHSKEWPRYVGFYDAVIECGKIDEMVEKLKEFGAVRHKKEPWSIDMASVRPHSREHLKRLVEYRQDEINSGIHHMCYSGRIYLCGKNERRKNS